MKNSYLLLIIFIISCTAKEEARDIEFPIRKVLEEKEVKDLNDYSLLVDPVRIILKNDQLFLENNKAESCFFVLNLPDLEFAYSFGERGQGPNEFTFPLMHRSFKSENSLFFAGFNDLFLLKEYEVMSENELCYKDDFRITCALPFNNVFILNDSLLIYNKDNCLPIINFRRDSIVGHIDHLEEDTQHDGSFHINNGRLASNGMNFVYAYWNKPQIDFYDSSFQLVKSIVKKYDPVPYRYGGPNEYTYYGSVYGGGKYVYCLYGGIAPALSKTFDHTLEVYNYQGDPVAVYTIKGKIPAPFVVDERSFTLYGLTGMEDAIYVYDLEGLK